MTALELVNKALIKLNQPEVTLLSDTATGVGALRSVFSDTVNELFEAGSSKRGWSFMKKRVALVAHVGTNITDYTYMYDFPSDCVVPLELKDGGQYEIESGVLYTDDDEPVLIYTYNPVTTTVENSVTIPVMDVDLPSSFQEALAARMASKVAGKVTESKDLPQSLFQEYFMMLRTALQYDAMLTPVNDDEEDIWGE